MVGHQRKRISREIRCFLARRLQLGGSGLPPTVAIAFAACLLGGLLSGSGCVVDTTEEDIYKRYHICQRDQDCADGWECRRFYFDSDSSPKYCMKICAADEDCHDFQFCGDRGRSGNGHCLTRCNADTIEPCPVGWSCMRDNLSPGRTSGYCHPQATCGGGVGDCGSEFDVCLIDLLVAYLGGMEMPFAAGGSVCVAGGCPATVCQPNYQCIQAVMNKLPQEYDLPRPDLCAPTCGVDGACPPGFRCLTDILEDYTGEDIGQGFDVCFPGVPWLLPCAQDHDCYYGECVKFPSPLTELKMCAASCSENGECETPGTICLDHDENGVLDEQDYCFFVGSEGSCDTEGSPAECEAGQVCHRFSAFAGDKYCVEPCSGLRTNDCPVGKTCVPHDEGGFGCYYGMAGLPCHDESDCVDIDSLEIDLICAGPSGQKICTHECTALAQCNWTEQRISSLSAYCREISGNSNICWPLLYECRVNHPNRFLDCSSPELECIDLDEEDGSDLGFCTRPCPQSRPGLGDLVCPYDTTCVEFPTQGVCFPGFVTSPCSTDEECISLFGLKCASISDDPDNVDGMCSVACTTDDDCKLDDSDELNLFCLPGTPDEGQGQCFTNLSVEMYADTENGRQGALCGVDSIVSNDSHPCLLSHDCYHPPGQSGDVLDFCAERCQNAGAECSTPGHICTDTPNQGLLCLPDPNDPSRQGRASDEPCRDHRQCASGVCHLDVEGELPQQYTALLDGSATCR
jgi:hypothetical protein